MLRRLYPDVSLSPSSSFLSSSPSSSSPSFLESQSQISFSRQTNMYMKDRRRYEGENDCFNSTSRKSVDSELYEAIAVLFQEHLLHQAVDEHIILWPKVT